MRHGIAGVLLLALAGCGAPAVLRAPAIQPDMVRGESLPVAAIAEPTGDAPISLPNPAADPASDTATPPAAPRSDRGARP